MLFEKELSILGNNKIQISDGENSVTFITCQYKIFWLRGGTMMWERMEYYPGNSVYDCR